MATVTGTRWTPESTSGPTTRSDEWDLGVATGLVRVGAGVLLWRSPSALIRMAGGSADDTVLRALFRYFAVRDIRSEERRVGKERSCRWAPRHPAYHQQ